MPTRFDISILILAAGHGSRFDPTGKQYKLLQKLPDGRTIIRATCESCQGMGAETIVICGEHADAIDAELSGLDVRLEYCRNAQAGMGASLKHGLQCSRPATGWIIMLGDMPGINTSTIQAVAAALSEGAVLARPYLSGQPGHPVGVSRLLKDQFLVLRDDEGGVKVLRSNPDKVVRVPSNDFGCVYDIDYPEHIKDFPSAETRS